MSAGTKVTIAVIVLFAVVLGVYYGFSSPDAEGVGPLPPTEETLVEDETVDEPAGVLSASVGEALAGEPDEVLASDPPRPVASDPWVLRAPPVLPEPEPEPAPAAAATPTSLSAVEYAAYTVREDDTLWDIAHEWLGDGTRWQVLADANPQIDPNRLRVGQRLRIPRLRDGDVLLNAAAAVPPADPPTRAVAFDTFHTVRAGESLSTIAKRYYGSGSKWQALYDANRAVIGWDPDRLKVGMRLRIP